MYPAEFDIKDTSESITSASGLDLLLSIGGDGQLHTSIYDKRDDSNFHITSFPSLSSNNPSSPMAFLSLSLYDTLGLAPRMIFFITRARRLPSKVLKQGYLMERLKLSFRIYYSLI